MRPPQTMLSIVRSLRVFAAAVCLLGVATYSLTPAMHFWADAGQASAHTVSHIDKSRGDALPDANDTHDAAACPTCAALLSATGFVVPATAEIAVALDVSGDSNDARVEGAVPAAPDPRSTSPRGPPSSSLSV